VDYSGNNGSVNVSIITNRGKNYAHFNFSSNFSGFVAYTIPEAGFYIFTGWQWDNTCGFTRNFTAGTMFLDISTPTQITLHRTQREEKFSSGRIQVKRSG